MKKMIAAAVLGVATATAAVAAPVIVSYDITHAETSGFGGWHHTYNGTIAGLGDGLADYYGGSGTLNDGSLGTSEQDTQLFGNSGVTITLFLDQLYTVNSLSIFGGNYASNSIPGALRGMSVKMGNTVQNFFSTDFGVKGDFVDLAGTDLALQKTDTIVLSNFVPGYATYFSIAEIVVDGVEQGSSNVPEPGSLILVGMGLAAAFGARRKQAQ